MNQIMIIFNVASIQMFLMMSFLHIFSPLMILIPLLLMLGGYLVFSILLFYFPTILHKRMRYDAQCLQEAIDSRKILRIAHRGGPRHTTENTIEAFKKAQPLCDMFQTDVCETKDGVLVVHHDHDLLRTCGVQGFIRDFNFKDLPLFKKEIELNFAPEGLTVRSNKEKIPTLEELFKTFPNMPMNIQLKTPSTKAIKEFLRLIAEYKRNNISIVGIRGDLQEQLRQQNLKGFRWINDKDFYTLLIYWITGLLPFVYLEEVSIQIPLCTEQFYLWKIREWGNNWKTHAYFKVLKILNIILQPLVSHLKKRGIMTYYWVCNTQKDINQAIKYGACGVMTDDPELLDKILQKYNQSEEKVPLLQQEKKAR